MKLAIALTIFSRSRPWAWVRGEISVPKLPARGDRIDLGPTAEQLAAFDVPTSLRVTDLLHIPALKRGEETVIAVAEDIAAPSDASAAGVARWFEFSLGLDVEECDPAP